MPNQNIKTILITGGSGFLGTNIIHEFLSLDSPFQDCQLINYDIKKASSPYKGVTYFQGDICNQQSLIEACKGVDLVIHSAAIVDWGTKTAEEVHEANYSGTENVLNACRENKVPYLIYTSTLDVVFSGKPLIDIDETYPYPESFPNMYCESKAQAERLVLQANSEQLKTAVLRPGDIYGEADPYHIGSLVEMAKTGFYVRLGDGSSKSQHIYVGNMAHAHVLLAKALIDGNQAVEGQVYFITDAEGHNFFRFFDQIITGAGYQYWPKDLWIPRRIAYAMGSVSETIALLMRPIKHYNPKFSRFAVVYTCSTFTFSSEKAKNDFGFYPKYSASIALERTIDYYKKERLNGGSA